MAFINPNIEARHWHIEDGNIMACDLCPHRCRIQPEGFGRCTARKAVNGKLVAYNYGRISSMAVDPIEKKPFYHYRPGTRIFSVVSVVFNLHCE